MAETFVGSVEILTHDHESIGIPGQRWSADAVPVVLATLHGITDLREVIPQPQPTGRTPEYQWAGMDAQQQPVTVLLWRDVPYSETAIAQAIAAAIAGQG